MKPELPHESALAQAIEKLLEYIQQRHGMNEEHTYVIAATFIRVVTRWTEYDEELKRCMDGAASVIREDIAQHQSPNN